MKVAVVLGGAACVWDDVAELGRRWPRWVQEATIYSVNDVPTLWPARLDHWCTLHPERLTGWVRVRRERSYPEGWLVWCPHRRGTHEHFNGWVDGSSGLYATSVALIRHEHDRVLLCGVPMQPSTHVTRRLPWNQCYKYTAGWERTNPQFKLMEGHVFSFSGRTRELLGFPDFSWVRKDLP